MRILHAITKGDVGGAQTNVLTLAAGLVGRGHHVEVVTGALGPVTDAIARAGAVVRHEPTLAHAIDPSADRRALARITALLDEVDPDVVHLHSSKAGLLGRIAARRRGVPAVYTAHGWPFQAGAAMTQRVVSFVGEAVAGHLGGTVICVSEAEAALARRYRVAPAGRIVVVPNGIDDRPVVARPPGGPVRITMVARLAPPKLPLLLVDALARLGDLPWTAVLAGGGVYESEVRALVAHHGLTERIAVPGDVTDVPELLDRSDVGVLCSRYEGLPLGVIESMRAGLAVVASRLPGTEELLAGGAGLLVANETGPLAEALATVVRDDDRRADLGERARRRYEERYRAETMIDAIEEIYRRVVARRPRVTS